MRSPSLLVLAVAAIAATSVPALARGHHGGGHHGGGHHFGGHYGGGHHFGGHGFSWGHVRHGGPRFVYVPHRQHHHVWRRGAPVYYVSGPRPVGGCTTSRHVGWTRYGWHKIVTTRTCLVP